MKKQIGDTMWIEFDDIQTIGPFRRADGWTKFPVRMRRHSDGEIIYTTSWEIHRVCNSLGLQRVPG